MKIEKKETEAIKDILYIENYFALWICIKGILDIDENININDLTNEQLRKCKRKYIKSSEALKLMGIKIEKDK